MGIFRKKSLLSLTPLILVDYSIHIDTITMGQTLMKCHSLGILYLSKYMFASFQNEKD